MVLIDINCGVCGEPWAVDEFHDIADELDVTFAEAMREFQRIGCEAIPGCSHNAIVDDGRAMIASIANDLLGDDVDGIASMMDDAEYLGLL